MRAARGVLLEFHRAQGVSGCDWMSECIFSRRVTRSWLNAENMIPICTWRILKRTWDSECARRGENPIYVWLYGVPCTRGLINMLLMGSGFMAGHRINSSGIWRTISTFSEKSGLGLICAALFHSKNERGDFRSLKKARAKFPLIKSDTWMPWKF
jgi:hypothetical protein